MLTARSQEPFSLVLLGLAQTYLTLWEVKLPRRILPPLFSAKVLILNWKVSHNTCGPPRPDSNSRSETPPKTPEVGSDPVVGEILESSSL